MIKNLRFLSSAFGQSIAGSPYVVIHKGQGLAQNGRLVMSAPLGVDFDCQPQGKAFLRAVEACKETFALHLSDTGNLIISEDGFRVTVPCAKEELPNWTPPQISHGFSFPILPILKTLAPFIGSDSSRIWTNGILLKGQSAFVTNNPVLLEHWLPDFCCFEVCIPGEAVRELLKIGEEPEAIGLSKSQICFYFSDQRWMSAILYEAQWPDVGGMLDESFTTFDPMTLTEDFWQGLDRLVPLTEGDRRVWLKGNRISSSADPETMGASVEVADSLPGSCHTGPMLLSIRPFVEQIQFDDRAIFCGGDVRGMLAGIRP